MPLRATQAQILRKIWINLSTFQRTRNLFLPLLALVLSLGAELSAAKPAYVLLTAQEGAAGGENLPQQLAKWRQLGLVADAQLLANDTSDASTFGVLGILEFPNEAALLRWQDIGRVNVSQGVIVTPVEVLAHGERTPRDSSESIFLIAQYEVTAGEANYRDYVDGYVVPQMKAWIDKRVINRYTSFYAGPDSDVPWDSLLVMEYRDPHSLSLRDQVKDEVRARLSTTDKQFKALHEAKQSIRQETAVTRFLWFTLPAPDLSDLPSYEPQAKLKGSLRIVGSELKNSVDLLAEGFTYFHPDVKVATSHIPSSEGGIAGLYLGVSDVAPMGDDAKITDLMPFVNTFGYLPTEISVATGGYEKRGSLFAWAIVVNKNNPLDSISVDQFKRVFGGERTGGWEVYDHNYKFTAKYAVKREDLIRTWGELGVKGKYAKKGIETFGYASPGFATSIERHYFHWSKKWNGNFREYVEAKQAVPNEGGYAVSSKRPLEDLETNEYAIGIAALMHAKHYPNIKVLAVSQTDNSEPIPLTPENVANRSYPLIRDAYFYVNKAPERPLDPIVLEFMRYCLSREGQQTIAEAGYYYPLPHDYLLEQREKLD